MSDEKKIDDGGPAFPGEQGETQDGKWNQTWDPGMSLRDYAALKAWPDLLKDKGEALSMLTAQLLKAEGLNAEEGLAYLAESEDYKQACRDVYAGAGREAFQAADAFLKARQL